jgi:crotonobetainyl-CoA:carnitine CoA-transferase CaiB-like acyl-CoA transferase
MGVRTECGPALPTSLHPASPVKQKAHTANTPLTSPNFLSFDRSFHIPTLHSLYEALLPTSYLIYSHLTQNTMSALLSVTGGLKLDRAGRDNTLSQTNSPTHNGDRTSALTATNDIMAALLENDKLCVERCHSATDIFKAAAAKIEAAIGDIEKNSDYTAINKKVTALQQKKAKLEQDWEQQVTELTCTNLEEREKCTERINFVARVAKIAGIDVRSSVSEIKKSLKDQSWWEEVNGILEQDAE